VQSSSLWKIGFMVIALTITFFWMQFIGEKENSMPNGFGYQKESWVKNPTQKQVLLAVVVWALGNLLLVLAITDLFRVSFINRQFIIIYFLMIGSTTATLMMFSNYRKRHHS
ncbi:MAG: hypothetical protein ORN54_09065, partial [Cyclobacteriaceae bacterium]|nr:hypothetical protein [Cyclobacteriaceae bacterium]